MNTQTAIFVILGIYVAMMVAIALYTSRRTKSVNDFMLGGRNVGPWLTAFSYGTTYFSAVVFIGYAGQFGWDYGVSAAWIGVGNAILGSLIPWFVLGKRTRLMTNHLGSKTMPEFFEQRFGSKNLKIASAAIVFVFLIPYTASVYNGLSRLFGMAFDLGENGYVYIIIAMAVLSAVYVMLGGYTATAFNDFFQGIIMLIGISAVVICTLNGKGGLTSAVEQLGQIEVNGANGALNSLFGPDPINLFGVVILTSLGTWGLPQMAQKFYAIKSEKSIFTGAIISTFFALVVAGGSYFMGGFVRLYNDGSVPKDERVPGLLAQALPELLIGLVVVLVLSASLSTLSSLVLTSSTTLTNDLIKPHARNMHDKKEMFIMRVLIAAFLIISVVIACNKNASITTLMSYSWGALSGAFLGPFLFGLFSKKTSKAAVITSFVTGIGIALVHMVLFSLGFFPELVEAVKALNCPLNLLSPINAGAIAMILSIVEVPLISMFTKAPAKEFVDEAFKALEK
ncbi:MAG: sodium:solute symporter family protein [Ruminococcaceae bacterium]|nr:sodium:solute symporter family protein [Oscillospiraceae bacterium]